jgi:hypothetical protein
MRDTTADDELFPLTEAPASPFVPRRRGRKIHIATVRRWATKGLTGVQLRTIRIGGGVYTSGSMLREFFDKLTAAAGRDESRTESAPCPTTCSTSVRSTAGRDRAIEQADRELARLGV